MKILIRENKLAIRNGKVSTIYKKMKKAVKRKLKVLKISLQEYLKVKEDKKENYMPFLLDFTRAGIGEYSAKHKAYKLIKPTGMNFFSFIYLAKKNMLIKTPEGWYIRSFNLRIAKKPPVSPIKWEKFVEDTFPRITESEGKAMSRGDYIPDSVRARMIKQYAGKGGWCQIGNYEDEAVSFIQCFDKTGKIVFWEDLPVFLKIATIIKLKPRKHGTPKPKFPEALAPKPASKMTDKEIYQYIYKRRGDYVKKVSAHSAGGWKFTGIPYEIFSEALKRRFIKKVPTHGWVLLE